MKISKVNIKWVNDVDLRLDGQYHLSDGPITQRLMKKAPIKVSPLSKLCTKIFKGDIFKRVYVNGPKNGLRFLTASDMVKSDLDTGKFISRKYTAQQESLMLKAGWILLSRSGTLGVTVFTNKSFEGIVGTDDLIRIIPNKKEIKPGFLHAYLASKFGYSLLVQSSYGGVIKHIEPHHIENLPVPIFKEALQVKVDSLVMQSAKFREEANSLLSEVHELFEESIKRNHIARKKVDIKQFKDLATFQNRFDASYHINLNQIESSFKKGFKTATLGSLVKEPMFTAQRGKRVYVKNGIQFLSTTDISQLNALLVEKYLSRNTPGLQSLIVKKNWILVSSSGQDISGSTFLVDDTYANSAVNQHSIRVIIDERKISPHYVFGFLSSPIARDYIRSGMYGSAILTINENFLERLNIPILSIDVINEIKRKIIRFQKCREQASFLDRDAISLVEKEISSWQK